MDKEKDFIQQQQQSQIEALKSQIEGNEQAFAATLQIKDEEISKLMQKHESDLNVINHQIQTKEKAIRECSVLIERYEVEK